MFLFTVVPLLVTTLSNKTTFNIFSATSNLFTSPSHQRPPRQSFLAYQVALLERDYCASFRCVRNLQIMSLPLHRHPGHKR